MSLLILLVYSFELYLNITYQCLSRCVCKAPDVLGTCSVLSTLKRGPSGKQDSRACQGRHRCTGSHRAAIVQTTFTHRHTHTHTQTHTHIHTPGMGCSSKVPLCWTESESQLLSCWDPPVYRSALAVQVQRSASGRLTDWLTDWPSHVPQHPILNTISACHS